nr:IS21 family transposase [Streptomyces parvulus]
MARETRLDQKTVRKYLTAPRPATPPRRSPNRRPKARLIDKSAPLVDSMLRAELLMKAAVIHGRLTAEYGFTGNYQRVKLYVQEARPHIAEKLGITPTELAGMHRRFEVIPGAQAQVDWGDKGKILAHMGIPKVYSFHMTLSYSRDPFCCLTTSQDLQTLRSSTATARVRPLRWGANDGRLRPHEDRRPPRHIAPGEAVPLHPEAVGFAGQYDFDIDVLAAYRPTGKGRVKRRVLIVRDHVLTGRSFSSVEEMDAAFTTWAPQRRAQAHRTHQQIIGERAARDHVALKPLPETPYLVAERHLRPVGKDCLVAFGGNLYSVPARRVRPRQLVEIRATKSQVMLHSAIAHTDGETLLATTRGRSAGGPRRRRDPLGRPAHRPGTPHHHRRGPATTSP